MTRKQRRYPTGTRRGGGTRRGIVAAGIAMLGLACAVIPVPPAGAQSPLPEAYSRVAVWPSQPQPRPAGELSAAAGVDVGSDGTIYVVDTAEAQVHALAPDGVGRFVFGGRGDHVGSLVEPRDVAVGGGRAYVTDPGARRVQVYDAVTGRFVATWEALGRPWGIAAGGGRVYVSDAERGWVRETDPAGVVGATWGAGASVPLELVAPRGLAVDGAGRVFVADPGAGVIFVVAPDRTIASRLRRPSSNPEFAAVDVAVDDGAAYAIAARQVFAFFSLDQETLWVPGPYVYGGQGIAVGPGEGYVATVQDERSDLTGVYRFATRRPFAVDAEVLGGVPAPLGELDAPRRIAAAGGAAFLLDARPRVQHWSPAGTPLGQWRSEGALDVAGAPDGDVFVVEPDGVRRRRPDGTTVWEWRATTPGTWLEAGAASATGLELVDLGHQRRLHLPPDGPGAGGGPTATPLSGWPVDVAAGGEAWLVADRTSGRLRRFDAGGGETAWAAPGRVVRVAGAPDGSAWFALTSDGWVWKYGPGGDLRAAWDGGGEGTPVDLDVDPTGRVLVADGAGNRVFVYAPDPTAERPAPPGPGDRCDLDADKTAAPSGIRAGDAVTVTLRVTGDCPAESVDIDVMLVLDRSSSMAGGKFTAARAAAVAFLGELDYRRARAGLVAFGDAATLEVTLSADPTATVRALARLEPEGTTAIGQALREARVELTGPRARTGVARAIVLLTDGLPQQPSLARQEAELARQAGIAVYAIGLGGDLDAPLLTEMAGGDANVFLTPSEAQLAAVFTHIARRLVAGVLLRRATIVDEVPANMALIDGSVSPPAAWDGTTLRWGLADVPPSGVVLRYRLRPQQPGRWPTNVAATGDYEDGVGFRGRLTFPVPYVDVAGTRAAYLPFVIQNRCEWRYSDIVLVIDTSTSMREGAGSGPTKFDAARAAARYFLGYLRLPSDRAAVVAFNTDVTLVEGLTGDRAALERALDRLPVGAGTRIDRGLEAAQAELAGPRRQSGHLPIVVMLTDGQPTAGTASDALARAAALRAAGTYIFTIGLGADADGALLADIAGDPRRFSYAPDQGALERIYRAIAWSLPCGTE